MFKDSLEALLAYVDPGSGALATQMVIAVVATAAYSMRDLLVRAVTLRWFAPRAATDKGSTSANTARP